MNKIIGILLAGLLGFLGCSGNDGKVSTVTGADKIASFQSKHKPTFDVNEQGQVVWTLISNDSTSIHLSSNNSTKLIRNTPSIIKNLWINDGGEVSWIESAQNGFVIYTYHYGKTTNVPIEAVPGFLNIQMNASGTVLWTSIDDNGLLQIYKYQNGSIEQITSQTNNLLPQINDEGDITWIELVGEMTYINFLSREGVFYPRINEQEIGIPNENEVPSYFVDMNENGDLVWNGTNDSRNLNKIFLFKDGNISQITEGIKECVYPKMNDSGDIVYHAFYDNANEIDLFGFGNENRSIARANKYFSPPQINNDGFILWGKVDNDDYSFLLRDDHNDIVKILMKSKQGYFDSGLLLANDRYVCFLDGKWVEDEFEYDSLYLFDLNNFLSLTDFIPKPFQDETHASSETEGPMEPIETVSQDWDNIEPLLTTTETIQPRDSAGSNEEWSFVVVADTRGREEATAMTPCTKPGEILCNDPYNRPGMIWAAQYIKGFLKPDIALFNGDMEQYMRRETPFRPNPSFDYVADLKTWYGIFSNIGPDTIMYPIKGNHEIFRARFGKPYRIRGMQDEYKSVIKQHFPHVWKAKTINTITPKDDYRSLAYYFTHKNAFFVIFDSNYTPPGSGSYGEDISNVTPAQIRWFEDEVVKSDGYKNAKFRFALSHYTLYASIKPKNSPLHKPNNTKLLESLVKHNFDAYFGACEHLYADKFEFTINKKKYHMPVVTCGPMCKGDTGFDGQSKILNLGDFNKTITGTPGFLRVQLYPDAFYIDFLTPIKYTWKLSTGIQKISSIKVEPSVTGPRKIVDVGRYGAGYYIKLVPQTKGDCDCSYRGKGGLKGGGCIITQPSYQYTACHCYMSFAWTCSGKVQQCNDPFDYHCTHPDTSKSSCEQGDGDCGGY
jgi:hypothetical protein